ncbi:potassium:proton antiporter [Campylobacter blaseri]|uniref:Potassium/proton antiporter n=1 Tax=Campylobacter blaseri TaxID=2042961 RepID=A0A2P8QZK9_9BACT|nr:potassium/proton antiporter [Campylobacter blaseri]PSM51685.1 potassium/proton antiporter [Campylobacter blaseri]PSM53475.1 potassium/proton antiporter [Campylobacter blaseri]QKF86280.1 potassium:proton antiporter [Campylobacter blaseri]
MTTHFIIVGILFIVSVFSSKLSDKYGIPALLIFLIVGMLAGSDGILKLDFDNAKLAGDLGTVALVFILFAGGLDTSYKAIKPIMKSGFILATLGVLITAFVLSFFIYFVLDFTFLESFLLACIISSTDAAAVFAILRSKGIVLKNNIGELLEFESGSNDPMAIFLTMTVISIIAAPKFPETSDLIKSLALQFIIGGLLGYLFGVILPSLINKIKLSAWGLYPVLIMAMVIFLFGITEELGGNGYIAVYTAGIITNKREFVHKRNLIGFFDGISWLMQVLIFLTLGLLVFPTHLPEVALIGVVIALFLMFVARPVSVFIGLAFSKFNYKEKLFTSWVGLRGVVPIILATYPIAEGINNAHMMFNIVFVMVLVSVMFQGGTLGWAASFFDIKDENYNPNFHLPNKPIFYGGLRQFTIPKGSKFIGHNLAEMDIDDDFLILLIKRDNESFKPGGSYIFEENDLLLIHCTDINKYNNIISLLRKKKLA